MWFIVAICVALIAATALIVFRRPVKIDTLTSRNVSEFDHAGVQAAMKQQLSVAEKPQYKFTRSDNGTLRFESDEWPDVIE